MSGDVVNPRFIPWLRTGLAASLDAPARGGLATADSASIAAQVWIHATGPDDHREAVTGPAIRLHGPADVVGLDEAIVVRHDPAPGTNDAEDNYLALVELADPDLPWRYTPASASPARGQIGRLQPWLALVVVEDRPGVSLAPGGRLPVLQVDDAARELPDLAQCWAWAHVHADHDLAEGIAAALDAAPTAFRSRLLSPRHLAGERAWIACVVPTFRAGLQAGLGEPVTPDGGLAWDGTERDLRIPVYHSWRFRTGPAGDFESLVRRLVPRELPDTVGRRDLDLSDPGGGLPQVAGTFVSFEGALVSAAGGARRWREPARTAMKAALASLLNDELERGADPAPYDALTDDPVVGPPAYAIRQAGVASVPAEGAQPEWLGELATEPSNRTIAAIGAAVIRRDQEALMAQAWDAAADAAAAIPVLGRARAAWEVAGAARPAFVGLADATFLQLAAPALARLVVGHGTTARGVLAASALPGDLFSGAFRRLSRTAPGFGAVGRGAAASTADLVTSRALDDALGFVRSWAAVHAPAGTGIEPRTIEPRQAAGADPSRVGRPGPGAAGGIDEAPPVGAAAARDRRRPAMSPDGVLTYDLPRPVEDDWAGIPYTGEVASLATLADDARGALDPQSTIRAMVDSLVGGLPADRPTDVPDRVFVRPVFTTAMYRRLVALSVEYLVPGIGAVPDDSVGLLLANRVFVEAFLAGLNDEMSREFKWREYPARLDGTWFQHFWESGEDGPADIPPIRSWSPEALGAHVPSGSSGAPVPEAALVLLVRSAILRRYPDLRVYAVEAAWDGAVRSEADGGAVSLPLFVARLGPDTAAFGFDLDEDVAKGSPTPADRAPGWFFVLEQVPGGPRFGLDVPRPAHRDLRSWSNLSWSHLAETDGTIPAFVDVTGPPLVVAAGPLPGNGADPAQTDAWGSDAAAMARIVFQRPVRMLVHADAMLPPAPAADGAGA